MPGLKKYNQKLDEMQQWYQSLPEDLDEDEDEDYEDQSQTSDYSDEESGSLSGDESVSLSEEEEKPILKAPIKQFTKRIERHCHRFFKPLISEQAPSDNAEKKWHIG